MNPSIGLNLAHFARYKPVFLVALVVLSGLFGYYASLSLLVGLAVAVLAGVMFQILLKQPALGVLAIIPVSLMGRYNLSSGMKMPLTMIVVLVGVLLAFWIFRMVALEREIRLPVSRVNRPALVFVLVTTLSLVFGYIPWLPLASETAPLNAQLGSWALYIFSMGMLLLVPSQIRQEVWLRRLIWVFLGLASVYILLRAIPGMAAIRNYLFVSSTSLGSMFWVWLVALTAGQAFFNQDLRRSARLFLFMLLGLTFYVSLVKSSAWHSGWIPPLIALGCIVWLRSKRLGAALTMLAVFFVLWRADEIRTEVIRVVEHYTVTSRVATWPVMIEIIKANPIIGVGPGNYRYYTNLYPILGYYIQFNSHNNYMDIVAQTGFLGLAVFGWLAFELARLALVLRKRVQSGFARGYVSAAFGGIVAMLFAGVLGDWFLPFIYNVGLTGFRASILAWLFLGGLVALEQIYGQAGVRIQSEKPGQVSITQAGIS